MVNYCIAIRRESNEDNQSPVIVLKRGLSAIDARKRAELMNRHNLPECRLLGGECFVAYNEGAE